MMDLSKRNKKVAIARWNKILNKERSNILTDPKTLVLKAILCGFLAGDGSIQKRKEKNFYHYQLDFFPDDIIMLNKYAEIVKQIYNKNPTIKRKNKFFTVRITSRVIIEDLTKYSNFGIQTWTLPKNLFIIKGSKEAWLRAFFSAEAYIGPSSIKIQTVNKKGMKSISSLLKELKIDHKYYEYFPKKKIAFRQSHHYNIKNRCKKSIF